MVDDALAESPVYPTFVHREDGGRYTVDGIGAMFRRYCDAKHENVSDFGVRDLRAKGATDMYRARMDIRHIQKLLGAQERADHRDLPEGFDPRDSAPKRNADHCKRQMILH